MKKLKSKLFIKKVKKHKILPGPLQRFLFYFENLLLELRITNKLKGFYSEKEIKIIKKEIAQLRSYSIVKKN